MNQQETHQIPLYVNSDDVTCFDSYGVEYNPKEINKFIGNKNITTDIQRIQANDSMCRYFCIGFIDLMLEGKRLSDYSNLVIS